MRTNFGLLYLLVVAVFGMESTEPTSPTASEILSANGYPGEYYHSPDVVSDHIVRLLTQLRTTLGFQHAQVVQPSQPASVKLALREAFYTAPDAPRFLHLGTVAQKKAAYYKGWSLALPMAEDGSSTQKHIHGFALFSVYPKHIVNHGVFTDTWSPQVQLHGYVQMQNVGDVLSKGGTPQRKDGVRPLPAEFVSLETVFRDVRHV
ncbi:uncharacterized protein SPSC_00078 [Sporisorium scitamineum]|uniref:Uncharacterized protein n=1 Tax=Sporisorium scitamineum TaxID=49012 RepID=A0A0F7S8E0_9BASI|nr:uncharacterized protein SPSC_00078 [Sporisorium scitamineum]CDW98536.1 hypothetical protein [Sporisorium scitamineum]